MPFQVKRLGDRPIIHAELDERMLEKGTFSYVNINGPCLIRVPSWVDKPLGRYYLYFAHRGGSYIRLAYANQVKGPWTVHKPGCLDLKDSHFPVANPALSPMPPSGLLTSNDSLEPHIASPDVVLDHEKRQFIMYFHGWEGSPHPRQQLSRVAISGDGLNFTALDCKILGMYLRAFRAPQILGNDWFFMGMPFTIPKYFSNLPNFLRSKDGLANFIHREKPEKSDSPKALFPTNTRHFGLLVRQNKLHVFWTRVGDAPECILHSIVTLHENWHKWAVSDPVEVLRPEMSYEGVNEPISESLRGGVTYFEHSLRDPCVFEDDDKRVYLLYTGGGEYNICLAELFGL